MFRAAKMIHGCCCCGLVLKEFFVETMKQKDLFFLKIFDIQKFLTYELHFYLKNNNKIYILLLGEDLDIKLKIFLFSFSQRKFQMILENSRKIFVIFSRKFDFGQK